MSPTQGMAEFFAMEAGEYLERLDALISPAGTPNAEEFVRLSRALRGSALMANQQPIAGAAGGLEALARAIRESRLAWDAANRQIAVRAVDDLKVLVRSIRTWSPAQDAKARAMAQELEQLAGAKAPGRPTGRAQDAGTRALVAREGAALATELVRVAVALSQNPGGTALAGTAIKVMQPLRGVAGLNDLPPLPDILEGVERAVGEVTRRPTAAAAASAVFRAAAQALARAAKEAAVGPVAADSPELAEFAARLRDLVEPGGAVPIESLYYADGGPHVVEAGKPAASPGAAGRIALVSHGEHLKQVSDGLTRATSPAQRDLRAQSLTPTLRALQATGGAVATFAGAAHEAVARAASLPDPTALVTALRDAGTLMAHATSADDPGLGEALTRIAASLRNQTAQVSRAATRAVPSPAVSAPAAAPAVPAQPPRRASGGAAAPGLPENADIAGSFMRYARFSAALGAGTPSIAELIAGPPTLAAPTAMSAAVSLSDLTYSGPAALQRAMSLQEDIRAALRPGGNSARLPDLLEEVFDLVKLGLPPGS